MKASLRELAAVRPSAPTKAVPAAVEEPLQRNYRVTQTRANTRQLSGHCPAEVVQAWRILAAEQDLDSQELLAIGLNMAFERFGKPTHVGITSGRRTKAAA